jgi:hypothetical protein
MNRPWTVDDDAMLRASYDRERTTDLALRLGRAVSAVYKRAENLGLSKPRIKPRASNAAPIGTIRRAGRQGYQFIKVKPGGWPNAWRRLHHVEWETANGPIPDGYVIAFRDGNVENIDIDNLELVHKDEWIKRYIPEHTMPPELAEVIRLKASLTRTLNQQKDKENEEHEHHSRIARNPV